MRNYSVIIIGGGPAGTTSAISLLNHGIKDILVLEAGAYENFVIGESIPPQSKNILSQLGIYSDFLKENHLPSYGVCSYWGNDKRGYNDTVLSPHGHGWHLDRRKFNQFLSKKAVEFGAQLETKAFFKTAHQEGDLHIISYEKDGKKERVSAQFVIDASGPRSVFAAKHGSFQLNGEPLVCLGRRFKQDGDEEVSSLTRIETTSTGWWYAAKLPNNEILVTLYSNAENVKKYELQKPENWTAELHRTKSIMSGIHEPNVFDKKIKGFKVQSFCLNKSAGTNWLAVGDAASAYDPLTSRGIYKSMSNALFATELISKFFSESTFDAEQYDLHIKTQYYLYLSERAQYYRNEQRWKECPFWQSFHQLEDPRLKKQALEKA